MGTDLKMVVFPLLLLPTMANAAMMVSYTGIVVDDWCERMCEGSVVGDACAIDGSNVAWTNDAPSSSNALRQNGVEAHTVHCMIDVPRCANSGYVFVEPDPETGKVFVKYRLDAQGSANVRKVLAKTRTTSNARMDDVRLTVTGMLDPDGFLSATTVSNANLDAVLGANFTSSFAPIPSVPSEISAHATLMYLSWGVFLPLGVLFARFGKGEGTNPIWFHVHRVTQLLGVGGSIAGIAIILRYANNTIFVAHHYIGLVVFALVCCQFLGIVRPHKQAADEARSWIRYLWEVQHKFSGHVAIWLGMVNCILGGKLYAYPYYGGDSFWVVAVLSVSMYLFFFLYFEMMAFVTRRSIANKAPQPNANISTQHDDLETQELQYAGKQNADQWEHSNQFLTAG